MARVSTAGPSSAAVMAILARFFEGDLIVNVGAGNSALDTVGTVLQMDHVFPSHPMPPFVIADARQMPVASGTADGVLLKDVLEHVTNPIDVLAEAWRVTRPDGRVVITAPRAIPRAVWSDVTHIRGFTKRSLIDGLVSVGWTPVFGPRRIGGFPGAARLRLTPHLLTLMRVPGLGHWYGTNWCVVAERRPTSRDLLIDLK